MAQANFFNQNTYAHVHNLQITFHFINISTQHLCTVYCFSSADVSAILKISKNNFKKIVRGESNDKKVKNILLERLSIIEARYVDFSNNPFDSDIAHDLRVSIRELRGLLNFIKPIIGEETYDSMNAPLREAAQVFGPIRELDVLTEFTEEVALEQPDLSEYFYDAFNLLGKERRKEMRRTFNVTNVELVKDALTTTKETLEELELDKDFDWDKYVAKRLEKKNDKLQKAYEEVDFQDYETVHDIRKDAKKNRYAAKYYKNVTSKKTKPYKKAAEAIQDEFGEVTDAHVNYDLLTDFADQVEDKDVRELFYQIRDIAQEKIIVTE